MPLFASAAIALDVMAARAEEWDRHGPDELIFATAAGNAIGPANLNHRVWTPALKRAGLGEELEDGMWRNAHRWHDLRHTAVSRLVAAGADVKLVQAVAGHANPLITLKRYSHLTDGRITEAAGRFDPGTVRALAAGDVAG